MRQALSAPNTIDGVQELELDLVHLLGKKTCTRSRLGPSDSRSLVRTGHSRPSLNRRPAKLDSQSRPKFV